MSLEESEKKKVCGRDGTTGIRGSLRGPRGPKKFLCGRADLGQSMNLKPTCVLYMYIYEVDTRQSIKCTNSEKSEVLTLA